MSKEKQSVWNESATADTLSYITSVLSCIISSRRVFDAESAPWNGMSNNNLPPGRHKTNLMADNNEYL